MTINHWDFLFRRSTSKIIRDHFAGDFHLTFAMAISNDQERQSLYKQPLPLN
ncbi:hypothetical protein [Eudoraea sp.]|uniref:hypothetical protein n=1 Tax=Eudoraea sp. TaxID=1979955 RepID=UPI003C78C170